MGAIRRAANLDSLAVVHTYFAIGGPAGHRRTHAANLLLLKSFKHACDLAYKLILALKCIDSLHWCWSCIDSMLADTGPPQRRLEDQWIARMRQPASVRLSTINSAPCDATARSRKVPRAVLVAATHATAPSWRTSVATR